MTAVYQIETREGQTKLVISEVASNSEAMTIAGSLRNNPTIKSAKMLGNWDAAVTIEGSLAETFEF